jgi:hypothetical protein
MVLKEVSRPENGPRGELVGVYGTKNQMPGTLMAVYYLARKAFIEAQIYKCWRHTKG